MATACCDVRHAPYSVAWHPAHRSAPTNASAPLSPRAQAASASAATMSDPLNMGMWYNTAMPKFTGRHSLVLGALALACHRVPEPRARTEAFVNPIVRQRADPHVYLDADGWYYYTATVPEYDRIELRRARSIQTLGSAAPVVIWRKHASGAMGAHIWAPEIHHIDGKWYVYFAAGRADSVWNIRLYALENASANPL